METCFEKTSCKETTGKGKLFMIPPVTRFYYITLNALMQTKRSVSGAR